MRTNERRRCGAQRETGIGSILLYASAFRFPGSAAVKTTLHRKKVSLDLRPVACSSNKIQKDTRFRDALAQLSGIKLKSIQPTETPIRASGNNDFVSREYIAGNRHIRENAHQIWGSPMPLERVRPWTWPRALALYPPRLCRAERPDASRLPTQSKCACR